MRLQNDLIHMIFTTEKFFDVAIKRWLMLDLNPRPLNFLQTLYPTSYQTIFSTHTQVELCAAATNSYFFSV